MSRRVRELLAPAAAGVGLVALLAFTAAHSAADEREASRYPYDPVCDWGRVANGKGMLVRCLTRAEATALAQGRPAPAAASTSAPSASATAPAEAPAPSTAVKATVSAVNADEGKLPVAVKRLSAALDRFADCVAKHGGLSGADGEVQVRFLVRARGRAEGVSVAKRAGVSADAARCIADVVDRRYVGTPDAPMVGATAIVKLDRVSK